MVGVQPRGLAAVDQPPSAAASRAVTFARSVLGVPYVWGGVTRNGFDCSGLCQWCYAQAGVKIPRTSSEQAHAGYPTVTLGNLAPGDLVFSDWPGDAGPSPGHVVIYIGNGQTIAAPHTGTVVQIESLDTFTGIPWRGACRPAPGPGVNLAGAPGSGTGSSSSSPGVGAVGAGLGVGLGVVILVALGLGLVAAIVLMRRARHPLNPLAGVAS